VAATATDAAATITSGTGAKTLAAGSNTISVLVTAEDKSTKTYTITVTRATYTVDSYLKTWSSTSSNYKFKFLGDGSCSFTNTVPVSGTPSWSGTWTAIGAVTCTYTSNVPFKFTAPSASNSVDSVTITDTIDGWTSDIYNDSKKATTSFVGVWWVSKTQYLHAFSDGKFVINADYNDTAENATTGTSGTWTSTALTINGTGTLNLDSSFIDIQDALSGDTKIMP
jgi:hypothetical protein